MKYLINFFYKDVVKKNLKQICQNISGESETDGVLNFDFIKYLETKPWENK